ncbi:MAG: glycoside hydrolase family 43 protein [Chloroflexota bacterium]
MDRPRRIRGTGMVLLLVFAAVVLGGASAPPLGHPGKPGVAQRYRNPVFAQDFPDPGVLKVGADYYAYSTDTGWATSGTHFPILRSRDLVHWTYVGDVFGDHPPAWAYKDYWAPSPLAYRGTYYVYYTARATDTDRLCVGVATASRPTGPFMPRTIFGCGPSDGQGWIDPAPLVDDGGHAYLYFKVDNPYHIISVLRLRPDLLHAAGPPTTLFTLSQGWEYGSYSTVEAPFPLKRGRLYYLFYSGNNWTSDYAMGYATATSPLGPFHKSAHNPILQGTSGAIGPGGGSVVVGPHGGLWMIYHAWTGGPGYDQGGQRTLRIDPLVWHGDSVVVRGPTTVPEPVP